MALCRKQPSIDIFKNEIILLERDRKRQITYFTKYSQY